MEVKVETWKESIQKDIDYIKNEQKEMKADIRRLQEKEIMQDQQIQSIQETLREIKDDIKWLRRAITNAIIVSVIGGVVALVFAAFKGGS
jgi:argininosuccinate lyase